MLKRFAIVALAFISQLGAQNGPDLQKALERLDKLEKQNQELMAEIQALRTELQKPAEAPPTIVERLDVQEVRTAELAQSKVDTSQHMPVSLTGMLLFNAFHNGEYGGGSQYPVAAGLTTGASSTGATFRQTVLGLKFNGPDLPGGGKASGSFYMDFWGGTSAPNNNLFHIRLATIDFAWKNTTLTVGQDKPIMAPREPTSLSQVGIAPLTGSGNLWDWQPQARIEQRFAFQPDSGLRVQAGIYETSEVYPSSAPAAYAPSLEKARPAWQGRFLFYKGSGERRFEIAPGFSVTESHVAGGSAPSNLATVDWLIKPARLFDFTGAFFHGTNAAGLGGLRQGFTVSPTGSVASVHVNGGWAQVTFTATPKLSFHLFGGEEADRSPNFIVNTVARNTSYAGNAIYKLAPNVLAAFELEQTRTTYLGTGTRLNNHYDLALAYLF